jgi:hypothetical protein
VRPFGATMPRVIDVWTVGYGKRLEIMPLSRWKALD